MQDDYLHLTKSSYHLACVILNFPLKISPTLYTMSVVFGSERVFITFF